MQLKPNPEDHGVITREFLKKLCKTDFKNYYSTPYLNDILYLHYKGFEKIANLEEYTGLKVLYMEGNSFKVIEGLQLVTNLRCLYLQENMIKTISGLNTLTELSNLNLSDNLIEKVQGLGKLHRLSNLQLKRNRIGQAGLRDLVGLLECQSISALDISDNRIDTQEFVPQILMKMSNIAVIYMHNNEFTKKISHYRKSIISKIPNLKYIDDKPIFEDERRFAEAWARGGLEQERKERALYKKEKEDEQIRQHEQFKAMMERYKQEGRKDKEKEKEPSQSSQNQTDSKEQSLQTYKSPEESLEPSEKTSSKHSDSESLKENSHKQESQKSQTQSIKSIKSEKGECPIQLNPTGFKDAYLDELD